MGRIFGGNLFQNGFATFFKQFAQGKTRNIKYRRGFTGIGQGLFADVNRTLH